MERREEIEAVLRWPRVVAIEPGRLPALDHKRFLRGQGRRLLARLPGRPALIVIFDDVQRPLALELQRRTERSELWDARDGAPLAERLPGRGFTPTG
jgi:hypothetical protein